MPKTSSLLYQEEDGTIPFVRWLIAIQQPNEAAFQKCLYLLKLLEEFGSELRRPRADYLQDGVYELRTEVRGVNFRILYGFVGKDVVLVTQGLTNEKQVPNKEIELAIERLERYRRNPDEHAPPGRSKMEKKITDGLDIIREMTGVDPRTDPHVLAYRQSFEIAQMIYDARMAAGLTQQQLAELVGTKQPVISQLENADYEGHSLTMLERIAKALKMKVELRLVPEQPVSA